MTPCNDKEMKNWEQMDGGISAIMQGLFWLLDIVADEKIRKENEKCECGEAVGLGCDEAP